MNPLPPPRLLPPLVHPRHFPPTTLGTARRPAVCLAVASLSPHSDGTAPFAAVSSGVSTVLGMWLTKTILVEARKTRQGPTTETITDHLSGIHLILKAVRSQDSLVVPALRLTLQCRGPRLNPWSGNQIPNAVRRLHALQLKIPHATTKTLRTAK